MSDLVDDILLLAELREQPSRRSTEPVGLAKILEEALADLRALQPERPIDVDVALDATVLAPREQLERLVSNIVGNTRRHTPPTAPVRGHGEAPG
jgi:two-component system OmpR family sensor kinase